MPIDKPTPNRKPPLFQHAGSDKPTRAEAEDAIRTLLRWTGEDPTRDGLIDTPGRVVRAWEEYSKGYAHDPEAILLKTFEEIEGYDEMIVLRGIRFESHCEHHLAPMTGKPIGSQNRKSSQEACATARSLACASHHFLSERPLPRLGGAHARACASLPTDCEARRASDCRAHRRSPCARAA